MFESGVCDDTLAVEYNGSQQNGPVLGNGCAAFLATFMMTLVENYEERGSHFKLDSDAYLNALNDTLVSLALEDAQCHGRLLVIQDTLCQFVTNRDASDQSLARLFYAKDVMVLRNK
jgi:hypothetical protein